MSPNHFVASPNVATLNKSLVAVVFFLIFPMYDYFNFITSI